MASWPPLAALMIYLALEVSWWWAFALVVPVLLAWQWLSLRRQANDALVAAIAAREELSDQVGKGLRDATGMSPVPEESRPGVARSAEPRVRDDVGAPASDGQSKDSEEPEGPPGAEVSEEPSPE